ncbi:MAG: serine hydrolase, partial [Sediminibacterium sp.]
MKNQFVLLLLCICFTTSAQVKNYYPPSGNWERKTPISLSVDSNLINEAIQYALTHETKFPKNLMLTQAMQFGKEPFSDPIGPMASRGPAAGIIVYKGYIIAEWGNLFSVEMVNSVTKSMLSTVVGLAVEKGFIRSIEDKVSNYIPPIELANTTPSIDHNPITQTSFIYPFETEHNRKIN